MQVNRNKNNDRGCSACSKGRTRGALGELAGKTRTDREPNVDIIVGGEGEATTVELVNALQSGRSLRHVAELACRDGGGVVITPDRPPIADLDRYRGMVQTAGTRVTYRQPNLFRKSMIYIDLRQMLPLPRA